MQTSGLKSRRSERAAYVAFTVVLATTMPQAAGKDISVRIEKAVAVLNKLGDCLETCLRPEEFASVDCAVVIPRFYRGAAVAGEVFEGGLLLETSFGRGFISCRRGDEWSAPGAVTMKGGSRAIQIGENIDVVILSMNNQARSQMLSPHFTIDGVASPASANGSSARADSEVKILILGGHGKTSAGIDLEGAVLQPDDSVNKALYGKFVKNAEIVVGGMATPARAQPLVSKLSALFRPRPSY
jgi:lipid-binding SYLF domain-containing protein